MQSGADRQPLSVTVIGVDVGQHFVDHSVQVPAVEHWPVEGKRRDAITAATTSHRR